MKRLLIVGALAVVSALSLAGTASASTVKECGDMRSQGVVNITARNMSCFEARASVRAWGQGYAPNMFLKTRLIRRGGQTVQDYRYTRYRSVLRFQSTLVD